MGTPFCEQVAQKCLAGLGTALRALGRDVEANEYFKQAREIK
jgi:Flp pilus assembly protein TadD